MGKDPEQGAIRFGEKLLTLLDAGSFTATYKYAVILALLDLCLEHADRSGTPPSSLTTRQMAEKTIELYWPQTVPFDFSDQELVLRQSTSRQAAIVSRIMRYRKDSSPDPYTALHRARLADPESFEQLVGFVEWKLIEMPLPRLQQLGRFYDPFIYQIGWDTSITHRKVRGKDFDNRILLMPGAGERLVRLTGLIRPLVYREWAGMVARINRDVVEDYRLEEFLFGVKRWGAGRLLSPLCELQDNRCFYCGGTLTSRAQVDHFIPWARYPDDGVENLVASHRRCNGSKRDFLAARDHVARWMQRFDLTRPQARQLVELAESAAWQHDSGRTLGVARAVYLNLPEGAKLWAGIDLFEDAEHSALQSALRSNS